MVRTFVERLILILQALLIWHHSILICQTLAHAKFEKLIGLDQIALQSCLHNILTDDLIIYLPIIWLISLNKLRNIDIINITEFIQTKWVPFRNNISSFLRLQIIYNKFELLKDAYIQFRFEASQCSIVDTRNLYVPDIKRRKFTDNTNPRLRWQVRWGGLIIDTLIL